MAKLHLADAGLAWSPLNRPLRILDRHAGTLALDERTKVCIYGCGVGAREAPLENPEWVMWGLNTVPPLDTKRRIRCDAWWDIHQRHAQTPDDLRWFRALPVPLVTVDDMMDLGPHCVRYPIEDIESAIAPGPFACTFAYQIAYALWLGYREIGLYGVELAYGTFRERTVEWASVSWWMGYAEAKGATLYLPSTSRLGRHPHRYGLDYTREVADVKAYERMMRGVDAQLRQSVGG